MKIFTTIVLSIFAFFQQDCETGVPVQPPKSSQTSVVKRGTVKKVITKSPGRVLVFPTVVIQTATGEETIALNSMSATASAEAANNRLIIAVGCIGKDRELEITTIFDSSVIPNGDHWDVSDIACVAKE